MVSTVHLCLLIHSSVLQGNYVGTANINGHLHSIYLTLLSRRNKYEHPAFNALYILEMHKT